MEHTPGLPKPPNERNSFINCWFWVWGMFQGYVGKLFKKTQKNTQIQVDRLTLRIQICPKKGIGPPTFLFFSDGIGTLSPIRSGGVWILRVFGLFGTDCLTKPNHLEGMGSNQMMPIMHAKRILDLHRLAILRTWIRKNGTWKT